MTLCRSNCRLLGAAVLVTVLTACGATVDSRGYVPDAEALKQIQPGIQTRNDVAELLGTPSTVTPLNQNTWIYVSRKTETVAFFEPKVLEQNVVVVEFNDAGVVQDLRHYTLADGQVIDPVTRKTPAPGKELTLLEQLIGNVGRFSSSPSSYTGRSTRFP